MATCVILCYHKVGSIAEEGRWLNVEPKRLHSHVRFFRRRGWRFVRASDLAGQWAPRSVCFTFDDAYVGCMSSAPAILESLDARGTFYAVPSQVGATSAWDGDRAAKLADWDALHAAFAAGHEIGNHSWSHPHLGSLSAEQQVEEIARAHEELERRGFTQGSICYPYGDLCMPEAVPYPVGLAVAGRPALDTDDRKRLPRIVVAFSDALPMLLYKIWIRPKLP